VASEADKAMRLLDDFCRARCLLREIDWQKAAGVTGETMLHVLDEATDQVLYMVDSISRHVRYGRRD
jgi:hypothetical protein